MAIKESLSILDIGAAMMTMPGERHSGDRYIVKHTDDGVLMAVVDGLGHGDEAAAAAKIAIATVEYHANEGVLELIQRCHEQLKKTRGAVMSVASIKTDRALLSWAGVGNVEGSLLRTDPQVSPRRESITSRGGVIGYQLPLLHASVLQISKGDLIILSTDGIQNDYADTLNINQPSQKIADYICENFWKDSDDALVLVARYIGNES